MTGAPFSAMAWLKCCTMTPNPPTVHHEPTSGERKLSSLDDPFGLLRMGLSFVADGDSLALPITRMCSMFGERSHLVGDRSAETRAP
eukprot:CAMPEP_0195595658 /NCGR_PEP_ID=MMETSP0815-20121206/2054_1 /TAXON_ID=97485 /ORGANISM="Prymnesium parvum, Strain Texoma1" /LENGTH=86 /DNA_ID=CAMNT_0040734917 /DNA_START=1557 /DNA_END=1815 /DNA_ORIENTATION=+